MSNLRAITKDAIARAGGPGAVGLRVNITRQAVDAWEQVPPRHVLAVEAMSGVSRYVLRPDIYGPPPQASTLEIRRSA